MSKSLSLLTSGLVALVVVLLGGCPQPYYGGGDDDDASDDFETITFTQTFVNQTGYYLTEGTVTYVGAIETSFWFVNLEDGASVGADTVTLEALMGGEFQSTAEATDSDGCTYEVPTQSWILQDTAVTASMTFAIDHWTGYCP